MDCVGDFVDDQGEFSIVDGSSEYVGELVGFNVDYDGDSFGGVEC